MKTWKFKNDATQHFAFNRGDLKNHVKTKHITNTNHALHRIPKAHHRMRRLTGQDGLDSFPAARYGDPDRLAAGQVVHGDLLQLGGARQLLHQLQLQVGRVPADRLRSVTVRLGTQ